MNGSTIAFGIFLSLVFRARKSRTAACNRKHEGTSALGTSALTLLRHRKQRHFELLSFHDRKYVSNVIDLWTCEKAC